jgi:nicotinamide riboside kinase
MEERTQKDMISPVKIVITGPESTGKSSLAIHLANYYNGEYIPEYAREYIEQLHHHYTFNDVEHIAQNQWQQMQLANKTQKPIVFFDTYLIITKVWFDVVFEKIPAWIDEALRQSPIDMFLLCNTDLPWEPDPVRENGGKMRDILFEKYQKEIEYYGFPYQIIKGNGNERIQNAQRVLDDFLKASGLLK